MVCVVVPLTSTIVVGAPSLGHGGPPETCTDPSGQNSRTFEVVDVTPAVGEKVTGSVRYFTGPSLFGFVRRLESDPVALNGYEV